MRPHTEYPLVAVLPEQVVGQVPIGKEILVAQLRGLERPLADVALDGRGDLERLGVASP